MLLLAYAMMTVLAAMFVMKFRSLLNGPAGHGFGGILGWLIVTASQASVLSVWVREELQGKPHEWAIWLGYWVAFAVTLASALALVTYVVVFVRKPGTK